MSKARDISKSTETLDVDGGTIKLDGNYPVGTNNVALGDTALDSIQASGTRNTAIGFSAGTALTTQGYNVFVGSYSGDGATGSSNVAVGDVTLRNTSGSFNTAIGGEALQNNTTASYNTAAGYQTGYSTTTGVNNTFMGEKAGYSNTTSDRSSYYGSLAGYAATGRANTFIGCDAGYLVTTGQSNTILGRFTGNQGGLDIRTSSNNIVLSDGDGNPIWYTRSGGGQRMYASGAINQLEMYANTTNAAYAYIRAHNGATDIVGSSSTVRFVVFNDGDVQNTNNSYGAISDQKLKENLQDAPSQWEDIKAVPVKKYSWIEDGLDAPNQIGVIAQELEAAGMSGLVMEKPDFDAEGNDLGTTTKSVKYSVLYMKAVKALQEAMERIETLEAKVTALEAK